MTVPLYTTKGMKPTIEEDEADYAEMMKNESDSNEDSDEQLISAISTIYDNWDNRGWTKVQRSKVTPE